MLLALHEIIHRSGHTDVEFHRVAYWFVFQKDANLQGDVLAYRTQGFVAPYVAKYVQHLEGMKHGL